MSPTAPRPSASIAPAPCFANVPDPWREVRGGGRGNAGGRRTAQRRGDPRPRTGSPGAVARSGRSAQTPGSLAGRRRQGMIVEAGHFALDPRLGAVAGAGERAARRRATRRSGADGGRGERRARPVRPRRARFRRARLGASDVRLLGAQRRREFAQRLAGDLQALGVRADHEGSMLLWALILGGSAPSSSPSAVPAARAAARQRTRRAGDDQRRLPRLHPADLEIPRFSSACRRPPSRAKTSTRSSDPGLAISILGYVGFCDTS